MNWVKEYYRRIECGDIVTSKRVRAVYSRLVVEMDAANDDSPYYFDEETGERPILFIETFCKQSQGTIGAPLELELFQKAYNGRLQPVKNDAFLMLKQTESLQTVVSRCEINALLPLRNLKNQTVRQPQKT